MKIKKLLSCVLSAALLSGCAQLGTNIESLVTPPKLSEEQTAIKQALINSVGNNVNLKYPKNGDYRSAYVIADIDGEGNDEAVVFYEKTGVAASESVVRMAVLDKSADGNWNAVFDAVGDGADVDKIIIGKLGENENTMIFVGYSVPATTDKKLSGYTYSGGKLNKIIGMDYVSADIADISGNDGNELLVLERGSENSYAKLFTIKGGKFTILTQTEIALGANGEYTAVSYGKVSENVTGAFLDIPNGDGTISTQVLYCKGQALKNPIYQLQMNAGIDTMMKTVRPSKYTSMDINSDGIIEIPSLSVMPGYETVADADKIYLTDWYHFDTDTLALAKKNSGYFSITDGYCLMLPSRWAGTVTVKEDATTDEVVFYKYAGDINGDMTELLRVSVVDSGTSEDKIRNGYTILSQNNQQEYCVKIPNNKTEALVPTKSELMYNFMLV